MTTKRVLQKYRIAGQESGSEREGTQQEQNVQNLNVCLTKEQKEPGIRDDCPAQICKH